MPYCCDMVIATGTRPEPGRMPWGQGTEHVRERSRDRAVAGVHEVRRTAAGAVHKRIRAQGRIASRLYLSQCFDRFGVKTLLSRFFSSLLDLPEDFKAQRQLLDGLMRPYQKRSERARTYLSQGVERRHEPSETTQMLNAPLANVDGYAKTCAGDPNTAA